MEQRTGPSAMPGHWMPLMTRIGRAAQHEGLPSSGPSSFVAVVPVLYQFNGENLLWHAARHLWERTPKRRRRHSMPLSLAFDRASLPGAFLHDARTLLTGLLDDSYETAARIARWLMTWPSFGLTRISSAQTHIRVIDFDSGYVYPHSPPSLQSSPFIPFIPQTFHSVSPHPQRSSLDDFGRSVQRVAFSRWWHRRTYIPTGNEGIDLERKGCATLEFIQPYGSHSVQAQGVSAANGRSTSSPSL
ncbi:hypothetical protein FB45DRAFT_86155 [Roridomyces roridus]|uniref:Uncharacterized protein n=1 Tax=Roridomyces roridus TaxID=1738132 RepID=A0AAD7FKA4_9AGAR|nr:hypothetical protein FB45DRAFT_86155 [Roridomyces roridus]